MDSRNARTSARPKNPLRPDPELHDAQKQRGRIKIREHDQAHRRELERALRPLTPSPPPQPQPPRQRFPWSEIHGKPTYPDPGQLGHYVPAPPLDRTWADSGYETIPYRQSTSSQYPVSSYYADANSHYYGGTAYPHTTALAPYYPYGYATGSVHPAGQQAAAGPRPRTPIIINNNIYQSGQNDDSSSDEQPQEASKQKMGTRRDAEPDDYVPYQHRPPAGATRLAAGGAAKDSRAVVDENGEPRFIINNIVHKTRESDGEDANDVEDGDVRLDRPARPTMRKSLRNSQSTLNKTEKPLSFCLNPLAPQDVTVHMSLDATDDLEGALEELSKHRRLGRFDHAIARFRFHLEHFLDNKYVLVQCGQCLLDAKQYRQLAHLAKDYPAEPSDETLQLSWNILLQKAEVESGLEFPVLQDTAGLLKNALRLIQASWPRLDSTEMQILAHCIGLSDAFATWIESDRWKQLYEHLQENGLIWEFRDLFLELEQLLGAEETFNLLVDTKAPGNWAEMLIDRLQDDWNGQDESSLYALIDIFSSLGLALVGKGAQKPTRDKCIEIAEEYVMTLVGDDEEMAHCRPCLRFVMAMVATGNDEEPGARNGNISFADHRRGDLLLPRHLLPSESLPIYAPVEDETPRWLPCKPDPDDELWKFKTESALELAGKLGDVEMQAACLQELMYQGELEAMPALQQLEQLWLAVGGLAKVHQAQLFRYMVAETPADREQLRRDILLGGEFGVAGFWEGYAQNMILRALTPKAREKQVYLSRAEAMKPATRQPGGSLGTSGYQRITVGSTGNGRPAKRAGKAPSYNEWRKERLEQINSGRPQRDDPKSNVKPKHPGENVARGDKDGSAMSNSDVEPVRVVRYRVGSDGTSRRVYGSDEGDDPRVVRHGAYRDEKRSAAKDTDESDAHDSDEISIHVRRPVNEPGKKRRAARVTDESDKHDSDEITIHVRRPVNEPGKKRMAARVTDESDKHDSDEISIHVRRPVNEPGKKRNAADNINEKEDPRLRLIQREIERDKKETIRLQRRTAKEVRATEKLEKITKELQRRSREKAEAEAEAERQMERQRERVRAEGKLFMPTPGVEAPSGDEQRDESSSDGDSRLSMTARVEDYEGNSDVEETRFNDARPEPVPERLPSQLMIALPGYDDADEEGNPVNSAVVRGVAAGIARRVPDEGGGRKSRSQSRSRSRSRSRTMNRGRRRRSRRRSSTSSPSRSRSEPRVPVEAVD